MVKNQELCKLIALPNPIGQPDIEDPKKLLFNKIFPLPRIPDVDGETSTYLNIYFNDFQLSNRNAGVKTGLITFEVLPHIDRWKIAGSGMLRPLMMLHEIDEMINNQRIIGIKKAQFYRCTPLFANSSYVGYRLQYEFASGN